VHRTVISEIASDGRETLSYVVTTDARLFSPVVKDAEGRVISKERATHTARHLKDLEVLRLEEDGNDVAVIVRNIGHTSISAWSTKLEVVNMDNSMMVISSVNGLAAITPNAERRVTLSGAMAFVHGVSKNYRGSIYDILSAGPDVSTDDAVASNNYESLEVVKYTDLVVESVTLNKYGSPLETLYAGVDQVVDFELGLRNGQANIPIAEGEYLLLGFSKDGSSSVQIGTQIVSFNSELAGGDNLTIEGTITFNIQ